MEERPSGALEATVFEPDPVIEAYKKDIDRTLLRENLKLTPEQRIRKLQSFLALLGELKRAGAPQR